VSRGGRRHGLDTTGKAAPLNVTLGDEAQGVLDEIAARTGLSRSAVLRLLLTHPDAMKHVELRRRSQP
jgi:hypothetical protein